MREFPPSHCTHLRLPFIADNADSANSSRELRVRFGDQRWSWRTGSSK